MYMLTNVCNSQSKYIIEIYDATSKNKPRDIDVVHNHKLYIATVSIKHKAVDHIKTLLRFLV